MLDMLDESNALEIIRQEIKRLDKLWNEPTKHACVWCDGTVLSKYPD